MYVFIDTNIFLSFFHLTSEDLEELEKLVLLIENKELNLILPRQVIDETRRNRSNKVNDSFAAFNKIKFNVSYPAYCKDYREYNEMRNLLKKAEEAHATLTKAIQADIEEQKLKADKLLTSLFDKADIIERTSTIINAAELRVSLGNPPGKKGSLGDAVNWETLIAVIDNAPVHLITEDSDFYSPLSPNRFNEFLQKEWKEKKGTELNFHRKLSDFFNKNFPTINLKTELEKDKLIEDLSASGSFAQTHSLIAKLGTFSGFTQKQAEDLVRALINNNQVNWIIEDEDVLTFYQNLRTKHSSCLKPYSDELDSLLSQHTDEEDDIPF